MGRCPTYPTDFNNYDDLIKEAYGSFEAIASDEILIKDTIISKRFCSLFPSTASCQIQKILNTTEESLVRVLGQNFARMLLPVGIHQKLYTALSKEEITLVTTGIKAALDLGYWDQDSSMVSISTTITNTLWCYKIWMPFTFAPVPPSIIKEVGLLLDELECQLEDFSGSQYKTHPADIFVFKVGEIAEKYFQGKLTSILSRYPVFSSEKGADFSEWGHVITIKWCDVILSHIKTISEYQFPKERYLIHLLSQKAISLEMFMTLDLETALVLQAESEQAFKENLKEKRTTEDTDSKYTNSIPWHRSGESLQTLLNLLSNHGYIEQGEFQSLLSSHFHLGDEHSRSNKKIPTQKIIWKSSLPNLLAMIETLTRFNIISVDTFKRKAGTEAPGCINNLIHEHFCKLDNKIITLDAIRKAAARRSPDSKIDTQFNKNILQSIRSIQ